MSQRFGAGGSAPMALHNGLKNDCSYGNCAHEPHIPGERSRLGRAVETACGDDLVFATEVLPRYHRADGSVHTILMPTDLFSGGGVFMGERCL
jgi:hypothetical protein